MEQRNLRDKSRFAHLLYTRGYLFSEVEIQPPVSSWSRTRIGRFFLSFDPVNAYHVAQEGGGWVVMLGTVIDTSNYAADMSAILQKCLKLLEHGEEGFLDYIDELCGRFIIAYHSKNRTRFMTDACGLRSAFYYCKDQVLIASHCRILADLVGVGELSQIGAMQSDKNWLLGEDYYPGNLTPFDGVYFLTPNTLIDVEDRQVRRFFPRKELGVGCVGEVAEEVSLMLKNQVEVLNRQQRLAISLTAGLDSRVMLAASRQVCRQAVFFTYVVENFPDRRDGFMNVYGRQVDMAIAKEIVEFYGLNHYPLQIDTNIEEDFQEFDDVLNVNTFVVHGRRLAKAYYERLPKNVVHIRSNVSEVGRAFYRKQALRELPLTPERMAHVYKRMSHNEAVVDAFRSFVRTSSFDRILNYDPYDMFYWEHRLGTWHSCVLLESDVAFDTFIPFNCRSLLMKMLSVPLEDRISSRVHYEVTRRLWAELLLWPINQPPMSAMTAELESRQQNLTIENRARVRAEEAYNRVTRELQSVKASTSYQLGHMIVQAMSEPGRNTILLPYRLIRLLCKALRGKWLDLHV